MNQRKILVVEDDRKLAEALSQKLEKSGFEPILAYNGQEGLERVESQKPDLILLDIIMPVMDGLSMLRELRKQDSETPVIILSNLSGDDKLSEALAAGSYDYLVKTNYSLEEVINKINQILGE